MPPDENPQVKESAALESKSKSYFFLLLVLGLAGLSGYFFSVSKIQYGLDVNGGVRIEYKMKTEDLTAEQRADLPSLRAHMQNVLTNRVGSALGVVEGSVIPKGDDSFIIEIPGFTDAQKARDTLSTTASIELYHAKTVVTTGPLGQLRQFDVDEDKAQGGKPMVTFRQRTDATKVIKPGTPEYAAMIKTWDIIIKGDELSDAFPEAGGPGGSVIVGLKFSNAGSKKMEAWSRRYLNQGEMLASVLDGVVLNIAPLAPNAILKDGGVIQGKFEAGYVKSLTDLLKAGSLPVGLVEQSVATVDPTIGKEALKAMQLAGLISFAVVALFLIVYYAFPGVVALFALLLYILFTLTAMKIIGATFSLAAIAGFILSIGVAVDANILVFERVKEEIRDGRALLRAVELGFRKALPSIIDSNSCTILTSLVLVNFGTGPVKGFATTLILGVFISLFTAITVTRSLLVFLVGSGIGANPKAFALGRSWFGERFEREATTNPMKIMQKSRKWFMISLATIIPGLIFLGMGGLKANVEFVGGYRVSVQVPDGSTITSNQILENLEKAGYKGSNVSFSTTEGKRYASMTVPGAGALEKGVENKIAETAGFKAADIKEHANVGAAVQKETVRNAILGVVFSALAIMLYLGIRFGIALGGLKNGIKFGLSAIGAMLHDVLVVLGVAAIMGFFLGWEMSALFITAMLTVIGFSVHDTVVVFDRIRENLRRHNATDTFEHICNVSVSQSFARSINTSLTVIVTLLILILFGTPTIDLKFFCLAMLAGIVSGTYSSIYNATPILYLWDKAIMKKRGEKAGMVAESEAARIEIAQQQALLQQEMGLTQPAGKTGGTTPAGYSQVKRRDSVIEKSKRSIDHDDDDKDKD